MVTIEKVIFERPGRGNPRLHLRGVHDRDSETIEERLGYMSDHKFEINDVVFHKKKRFIGYIVQSDDPDKEVIATPKGTVHGVKRKNLIKVGDALTTPGIERDTVLKAIKALPEGSTAVDDSGDLWIRTRSGWESVLFGSLTIEHWFNSPSVRVYPAISQFNFISKKEASCVGY